MQDAPRKRGAVQEEGRATAQQVVGDVGRGQVTVRAVPRGVVLSREQAVKHRGMNRPILDACRVDGFNE